jgi:excisionase family DNA binding protein
MTVRLAANPDDAPRPSARLDTVAATLECDPSTVRKLLRRGLLQGHRVGRGVRVYLDSVRAYQERTRIGGEDVAAAPARRLATAAHREAMAFLRGHGVV